MQWGTMAEPVTIKKYGNRRLYDTSDSRYITLVELEELVRRGTDVRVVDAKSGEDLTQTTLVQVVLDGRGGAKLLPAPLLAQLIRLGDDALNEFFGQYVGFALEAYLRTRQGVQAVAPYNPLLSLPLEAANQLMRLWGGRGSDAGAAEHAGHAANVAPGADAAGPQSGAPSGNHFEADYGAEQHSGSEIAALRAELDELRASLQKDLKPPKNKKKSPSRKPRPGTKR